jgi:hypothetical protein
MISPDFYFCLLDCWLQSAVECLSVQYGIEVDDCSNRDAVHALGDVCLRTRQSRPKKEDEKREMDISLAGAASLSMQDYQPDAACSQLKEFRRGFLGFGRRVVTRSYPCKVPTFFR